MKVGLLLASLLLLLQRSDAQHSPFTRLYFHHLKSTGAGYEFRTTLNPDNPIVIGQRGNEAYVLVETDADSLGVKLNNNQTVYIPFKRGQTYYFRLVSAYLQPVSYRPGPMSVHEVSEQAFWLNIYLNSPAYRHYRLTKASGVELQEDTK